MKEFHSFIEKIDDLGHREIMANIVSWVHEQFPGLERVVKWNQPMFLDHGTFIIAFSIAKGHFSLAPEAYGMEMFREKAIELGYNTTKMLIKVKWNDTIDYEFLRQIIDFNIADKKECNSFWRQ